MQSSASKKHFRISPIFLNEFFDAKPESCFWTMTTQPMCADKRFPGLWNKIAHAMSSADAVVVGNRHLAEHARQFSDCVTVIPTVVDWRVTAAAKADNQRHPPCRMDWHTSYGFPTLSPDTCVRKHSETVPTDCVSFYRIGPPKEFRPTSVRTIRLVRTNGNRAFGRMRFGDYAAARYRICPRKMRAKAHSIHGFGNSSRCVPDRRQSRNRKERIQRVCRL